MAGYYDESDDNQRAYAVAGFLGHQHDCVHLDLAWRERILCKYDLRYFKASELESGCGEFAKFRDDPSNVTAKFSDREKKLFREIKTKTIDLILEFDQLVGIGAVLMLPDYLRLVEEYRDEPQTIISAPYFFCAQLVMMQSGFVINRINDDLHPSQHGLIRPVFDSHEEYSSKTKRMFDDFCQKNPISSQYLLEPYYESDMDYVMLQVADNLAYECRRLLITTEYDTHIPERTAIHRLKERIYKVYKLDYGGLKALIEAQRPDSIPFEAEIKNTHQLLKELDRIETEAERKPKRNVSY